MTKSSPRLSHLEVRKSDISGKGVFACISIKQGVTICFFEGELCSLDEMIKRVDDGKEEGSDPLCIDDELYLDLAELFRNFNHSCNPNAFVKGKNELVAMKDVKEGEEITFDYSTTMNDNKKRIEETGGELWTCECECGGKDCRGIIDQFKTLPKERQSFYVEGGFMPDFMLRKFNPKPLNSPFLV
jgi:hypothetical protein